MRARLRRGLAAAALTLALSATMAAAQPLQLVPGQIPAAAPNAAPAPAAAPPVVDAGSPRAAFVAFRKAAHAARWADAAQFLALDAGTQPRAAELARKLNAVVESLFELDAEAISGSPDGRLDDGLPPDIEQIAQVERLGEPGPIRLVRSTAGPHAVWQFTPATVARIDAWYGGLYSHWLRERLVAAGLTVLVREGPLDIDYWQWLAFPILAGLAWMLARATRALLRPIVRRLTHRTSTRWDDRLVDGIGPPLTLAWGGVLFAVMSVFTDLSRGSAWLVTATIRPLTTFALFWALWRIAAIGLAWSMSHPWAAGNAAARSLLAIGTNISRAALIGIGAVSVVAAAGFPVGTAIAGLGIGGLALAFGAQKTLENLFASVALALDQPIRVGDFVKVQDFVGTVEDIGVRSTRIRTLDRTLVTLPNGKLADERLESFEVRDRMRLAATLGLTYGTTRAQMVAVIEGLDRVLRTHPKIWPERTVVSFAALGESSLDIEVMAWFVVPTWAEFQQCRQEVLLAFMEVVERAGTSFAFPTRTVHLIGSQDAAPRVDQTT